MPSSRFGQELARLRKRKRMTIPALAKKAKLPERRLFSIERGDAQPLLKEIFRLAKALELSAVGEEHLKSCLPPLPDVQQRKSRRLSPTPALAKPRSQSEPEPQKAQGEETWVFWKPAQTMAQLIRARDYFGRKEVQIRVPGQAAKWVSPGEVSAENP